MGVILITGVPGSGKTTISKELSKKLNYEYVNVNDLVDECSAILEVEKDSCGNPIKVVDLDKLERCFKEKFQDKNVILEGVVVDFVPPEYVEKVIILRANPLLILERLLKRGYCLRKACENAEAEVVDSYAPILLEKYGDKVYEVLCDENCLTKIVEVISGKKGSDIVEWGNLLDQLLKACNRTQTGLEDVENKN